MEQGSYKFQIQNLLYGQIHYSIFKDHPKLTLDEQGSAIHSLTYHKTKLVELFGNTEQATEVIDSVFPNIHTFCKLPHFCRIGFEGIVVKPVGSSNYKLCWKFRVSAVRDCAINIAYVLLPELSKSLHRAEFNRYEALAQAIVGQSKFTQQDWELAESDKGKTRPIGLGEVAVYPSIEFNTLRVQGLFSPTRVYFQLQAIGGK
jgi:hypothetical protein